MTDVAGQERPGDFVSLRSPLATITFFAFYTSHFHNIQGASAPNGYGALDTI